MEISQNSGMRNRFLPFKYPDFGKLFLGQFISNIGSQFSYMALQFLIFDLTGDLVMMAVLAITEAVPIILIGPFAGVLIDRYDRKYIMAIANGFQAVVIFLIPLTAIYTGSTRIIAILVLAFLNSAFARFFFPARGASIPRLIEDKEDLFGANSLSAGAYQTSALIGPMLAGIIIGIYGYQIPFIIDSLTFIFSSICILSISTSLKVTSRSKQSPFQDLEEGARFIKGFLPIFYLLIIFSVLMFAGGATLFLIVPFLEIEFGLTSRGPREFVFGLFSALSATVGMLFAVFLSRKKQLRRPITLITYSLVLAGIMLIGFGASTALWMLAIAWIGFGTIEVAVGIPLQTIAQETVPDELRGKVFSFINLAITFSQIIGMGFVGLLAAGPLALRGTFTVSGLFMIIIAFFGFLFLNRKDLEGIATQKREEFRAKPREVMSQ